MTPEHWQRLSDKLADALESTDPRSFAQGDPELLEWIGYADQSAGWLDPVIHDPLLGRKLAGRFEILHALGRGGAAVVYLARDTQIETRLVVIKVLHDFWGADPWMRQKFHEEAMVLAKLDHPGIISLLDAGQTEEGRLFLLMPYKPGRTLRGALLTGALDTFAVSRWLRRLGEAVSYAHENGILHRDLKPENVLLVPSQEGETPMLIDFGIARLEDAATGSSPTTSHLMGSAFYMAPEHLMGKPQPASDLYSLAVVAWEMLTGAHPFQTASAFALPELQRQGVGDAFFRLRPDLGLTVGRLLARGLDFDPERRPMPVRHFAAALADAISTLALDHRLARLWAVRKSRRWMLGASAAALAGAAGLGAYLNDRWKPLGPDERVINYLGGASIEDNGFIRRMDMYGEFLFRPGGDYISCIYSTKNQGHANKPLTQRQKLAAFQKGWRMRCFVRPQEGAMGMMLDTGAFAPRYDVALEVRPQGIAAVAATKMQRGTTGPTIVFDLPPGDGLIELSMEYDPRSKSARVAAGGKLVAEGYTGHSEFREDGGIDIFIARGPSGSGRGILGDAHFEIFA